MITAIARPWIIFSAILVIAIGYYGQPLLNDAIDHYTEYVKVEAKETTVTEVKAESDAKAEERAKADADVKKKILDLLADRVYIPVYRVEDSSMPGYVGDPLSPNTSSSEFDFVPFSASSPAATGRSSLISYVISSMIFSIQY